MIMMALREDGTDEEAFEKVTAGCNGDIASRRKEVIT
jgi:hypothetical protein